MLKLLLILCIYNCIEKRTDRIKQEDLKFTKDQLEKDLSCVFDKFGSSEYTLSESNSSEECSNVRLLLMTVNDSEFYATLYYMTNKHKHKNEEDLIIPRSLTISGTKFYIGTFANIPTALVRHNQGSANSQHVAGEAFRLFSNLAAIIAVGVCGTFGELGDVIVSSKIVGYENIKYDKDGKVLNRDSAPSGSQILTKFLTEKNNWKFNCTNSVLCLSELHEKPILSASTLVAYQNFRDKIREDVCREAMGIEMEGIGVVNAKNFNGKNNIEFIVVKAGCDYATKEKNKKWQAVAAMAAADLVYFQFDRPPVWDWFKGM